MTVIQELEHLVGALQSLQNFVQHQHTKDHLRDLVAETKREIVQMRIKK